MTVEHHSFLIRIWRETTKSLAPFGEWQGEVQHIQSGCCWRFQSVEDLLDLIEVKEHDISLMRGQDSQGPTRSISNQLSEVPSKEKQK